MSRLPIILSPEHKKFLLPVMRRANRQSPESYHLRHALSSAGNYRGNASTLDTMLAGTRVSDSGVVYQDRYFAVNMEGNTGIVYCPNDLCLTTAQTSSK